MRNTVPSRTSHATIAALVLGSAALGCAGSAGLSRADAGFDAGADAGFDAPSLPEVADVPGELVDPCAAASVIDLNAIGLRAGRRVSYDIPPARPARRHELRPPTGCGVDVPDHDLHVFRYTTQDTASLRIRARRFGIDPIAHPPATLWLLDRCSPDSPATQCASAPLTRLPSSPTILTPPGIAAGTEIFIATLLEPGVWSIEVDELVPPHDVARPDAGPAIDATTSPLQACREPGRPGAPPRAAPPYCDPGLTLVEDDDQARLICAALLDPGAPCAGGAGASCDRPRCRDGACALLDDGYRCRLAGEEFGPCAIVGAPCRAGLQCSSAAPGVGYHTCREYIAPGGACGRDHPTNPKALCPGGYFCRASEPGATHRCLGRPVAGERCDVEGSIQCAFQWACVATPRGRVCEVGVHGGRCESAGPFACPAEQECDHEWGCRAAPHDGRAGSYCRLAAPRCDTGLQCYEGRCKPPVGQDGRCETFQFSDDLWFRSPCNPGQTCLRNCGMTDFQSYRCCTPDGSE